MFLMIGVSEGSKEFEYSRTTICPACGRYGRYIVFMTYTVLSLFFIPCIKWNRQYFVRMSCCGKVYRLDPEVGKRIARGEDVEIRPEDLEEAYTDWADDAQGQGRWSDGGISSRANWNCDAQGQGNWGSVNSQGHQGVGAAKICGNCGYEADPDFDYCPKCGRRL